MDASWHQGLSSTLYLPPSAFIRSAGLEPRVRDTGHNTSSHCWVAPRLSRSDPLRARRIGRVGLRNHTCIYVTCSGFWGTSNAIARCRSDQRLHLLPDGYSRHYTANIILHRLWSTTLSKAQYRLVRMKPPVPWVWVSPLGIFLILLFLYLVRFLCY